MALRFRVLVCTCLSLSIGIAANVRAEPITVTSGQMTVAFDDPSSFALFGGGGFELASGFVRVQTSPQQACLGGCSPGQVVNLSGLMGGGAAFSLGQAFAATVNGQVFAGPTQPGPGIGLTGTFRFDAGDVVLPPLPDLGAGRIAVPAPFVFQGQVAGFARDDLDLREPLFQVHLQGMGTAFYTLSPRGDGTFGAPEVVYRFAAAEDPIPEPATMLLLGTGLAGLVVRRARTGRALGRTRRAKPELGV